MVEVVADRLQRDPKRRLHRLLPLAKHLGLDVHQATISAAVLNSAGNLVMEAILEKTETILQFMHGLRGSLQVTFVARSASF
jgi:hypothetical protein